jgi:hypothetical protein
VLKVEIQSSFLVQLSWEINPRSWIHKSKNSQVNLDLDVINLKIQRLNQKDPKNNYKNTFQFKKPKITHNTFQFKKPKINPQHISI